MSVNGPGSGLCAGRVAIVTGAAGGIGREHVLELARQGAKVVVNDVGAGLDGGGTSGAPAGAVVQVVEGAGGDAVANSDDVSDWNGARRLVQCAIDTFGSLDVVVNNAGILRDRMLVNMSEAEWDDVIRVHLKGTAATSHWAIDHWRTRAKAGHHNDARIINTTSSSGLYGNVGQTNYGAAKAAVAALTIISAMEVARYGITVNAIAPSARTRMTENLSTSRSSGPVKAGEFDRADPANVAPIVAWLASPHSRSITGRVFNVMGGHISVAEPWHTGPEIDGGERWHAEALSGVIPHLVAAANRNPDTFGRI